jgi:Protein of unknown function (DUF3987)/Bifunctional DNA primase/polymerase, N-terminal
MPTTDTAECIECRRKLMASGYSPIPLYGKEPPVYGKNNKRKGLARWQTLGDISDEQIKLWAKTWPDAINTGVLTRLVPALDLDLLNEEAAVAAEDYVRERYDEGGYVLTRIGRAPKRAILFRTNEPFDKIVVNLIAPNGSAEKIEFLCDGQQLVVDGIHPDTGRPYTWVRGAPGEIAREDLPYIREVEAQALVVELIELLTREFGYRATKDRPGKQGNNGASGDGGSADWQCLTERIRKGESLHDSLRDLAAKFIASGMDDRAVRNFLQSQMEGSTAPRDNRWRERYDEIPELVRSAVKKFRQPEPEPKPEPEPEPEPVDLWGSFAPPRLPEKLLPKPIDDYAQAQARAMGVDPGGVAMAALAVCAGAIPDNIGLLMKQSSREWVESARLWVGLVGMPSTKKSPIIRAASKPLGKLDAILLGDYLCELERWKQLDKEARKLERKPLQKRLRLEDTTIEAAQEALAGSPNGVLLVQDELSGFFGAMDKYGGHHGAAKDRGFWLQAYNGGPYALNRISRGTGLIPNLSVSMLGAIQPDVIRRLASESYDDGFLQRMSLIVLLPAEVGGDTSPDISRQYATLIEQLTKLSLPVSGSWNNDDDGVLRFENRAQDIQRRLEVEHHALERIESISPKLAAHFGKLNGLFGRLCVTFHCIENAFNSRIPEFVTEDTADRVAKFMRQFLLPHALAFYSGVLGLSNDHDRLKAVAGYILAHKVERLSNRDIQRGCRSMRKLERRDTEAVFEQLEALGWLTRMPGPRLTVPSHWDVNPRVHARFAERAKAEAERRQRERAMILDIVTVEKRARAHE